MSFALWNVASPCCDTTYINTPCGRLPVSFCVDVLDASGLFTLCSTDSTNPFFIDMPRYVGSRFSMQYQGLVGGTPTWTAPLLPAASGETDYGCEQSIDLSITCPSPGPFQFIGNRNCFAYTLQSNEDIPPSSILYSPFGFAGVNSFEFLTIGGGHTSESGYLTLYAHLISGCVTPPCCPAPDTLYVTKGVVGGGFEGSRGIGQVGSVTWDGSGWQGYIATTPLRVECSGAAYNFGDLTDIAQSVVGSYCDPLEVAFSGGRLTLREGPSFFGIPTRCCGHVSGNLFMSAVIDGHSLTIPLNYRSYGMTQSEAIGPGLFQPVCESNDKPLWVGSVNYPHQGYHWDGTLTSATGTVTAYMACCGCGNARRMGVKVLLRYPSDIFDYVEWNNQDVTPTVNAASCSPFLYDFAMNAHAYGNISGVNSMIGTISE